MNLELPAGAVVAIVHLTAGLETQLGPTWPGGVEVSFGQWQKLALARGFMRDHPLLLVLDEPTAVISSSCSTAPAWSSSARTTT